jgi:hypothetical protein
VRQEVVLNTFRCAPERSARMTMTSKGHGKEKVLAYFQKEIRYCTGQFMLLSVIDSETNEIIGTIDDSRTLLGDQTFHVYNSKNIKVYEIHSKSIASDIHEANGVFGVLSVLFTSRRNKGK